jgi:hypothetical protein
VSRHLAGRFFRKRHLESANARLQQGVVGPNLVDLFFDTAPNEVSDLFRTDVADDAERIADGPQKNGTGMNGVAEVAEVAHLSAHGGGVCAQCNASGGVVSRMGKSGELLWLHPECIRFWRSPRQAEQRRVPRRPDNPVSSVR